MAKSKRFSDFSAVLAVLLLVICLGGMVRAEGSAVPGHSVGHVFLGMDRADVWKILRKPSETHTVPHGMSLYGEDDWSNSEYTLTVISERDKVIQVEFDSPRITTTDGLNTESALVQIRRRHPSMTVRGYHMVFRDPNGASDSSEQCYLDDVHRGIAFTAEALNLDVSYSDEQPYTLIVHRIGYSAVPISNGRWMKRSGTEGNSVGLSRMRSFFTPHKGN